MRHLCPYCLTEHDAVTGLHGGKDKLPVSGDFGFCFDCGSVFVFTDAGTRPTNVLEAAFTARDPEFMQLQAAWGALKRDKAKRGMN